MTSPDLLRGAFEEARARAPALSLTSLATLLGTTPGEIQAARLGHGVRSLSMTPCDLMLMLPRLGEMTLTSEGRATRLQSRVARCRIDVDSRLSARLRADALTLDILLPGWYWVCLSESRVGGSPIQALQVFDRFGRLLHQLDAHELTAGWRALRFQTTLQAPRFTRCIDVYQHGGIQSSAAVRHAWPVTRGEREFRALIERHRLRRIDANRSVAGLYAQPLEPYRFVLAMATACEARQHRRVSLDASDGWHRHSAQFERLEPTAQHALTMHGEGLTLEIDKRAIAEAWLVNRPCEHGLESMLEAFDHQGRLMAVMDAPSMAAVSD